MNNYIDKAKKFIETNKGESWFKPVVAIVVLLVIAFGVSLWRDYRDASEMLERVNSGEIVEEATEETAEDILADFWKENRLHFFVFGGLSIALLIVKGRQGKMKESGSNKGE